MIHEHQPDRLKILSIRIWFTLACYSNLVIGEPKVSAGYFIFWHVAGYASLLSNLTCSGDVLAHLRGFRVRVVAGSALGIIERGLMLRIFMRVVAGCAADSLIIPVITAAVDKPIGLKAHIIDVVQMH